MNVDKLQLVALVCEIFALGLAIIHVFRESLVSIFHERIKLFNSRNFSSFYIGASADYDSRSPQEAEEIAANNAMNFVVGSVLVIPLFIWYVEIGDSPLWWIPEFLVAVGLAGLFAALFRLVLMIIANLIFELVSTAGKGNFVIGLGTILAVIGITLETVQVWLGPYWWFALIVWGSAGVIAVAYLHAFVRERRFG